VTSRERTTWRMKKRRHYSNHKAAIYNSSILRAMAMEGLARVLKFVVSWLYETYVQWTFSVSTLTDLHSNNWCLDLNDYRTKKIKSFSSYRRSKLSCFHSLFQASSLYLNFVLSLLLACTWSHFASSHDCCRCSRDLTHLSSQPTARLYRVFLNLASRIKTSTTPHASMMKAKTTDYMATTLRTPVCTLIISGKLPLVSHKFHLYFLEYQHQYITTISRFSVMHP
jgi:hypothetical protein